MARTELTGISVNGKLTKRQKLLLGLAAVAILYAIYNGIIASPLGKQMDDPAKKMMELKTFVAEVTAVAGRGELSDRDSYMISRANTDWLRNPFYDKRSYQEWKMFGNPAQADGVANAEAAFRYLGYLEADQKMLAVINGIEYAAGERLEESDYMLLSIQPSRVVIANRTDGTKLVIPLQEE